MGYLKKSAFAIKVILISVTCISCVDDNANLTDPKEAFAQAREYYDDGSYDLAVQKLGEFKTRFPYSRYSTLAELFIANSNFELGNYEQAAVDYKQFVKLHPKNEKVPFAMYRVGESYWIDAPEDIDRDQELTQTALDEWQDLVNKFPKSQYTKRAQEKIKEGHRRIAESHLFVAQFYCKQEIYHACAHRSLRLIEDFKHYKDIRTQALEMASESFAQLAKQKAQDPTSDKNIFFKRMTIPQLQEKSVELKRLAAKSK